MGFLFQDAALFDSLTLYENLALPLLRLTAKSQEEVDFVIDKVLRQVGLAGDKKRMPSELSGGMRKRAGLARLHPFYPPFLFFAVIVMSHVYQAYMAVGMSEVWVNLTGVGQKWQWALAFNAVAFHAQS